MTYTKEKIASVLDLAVLKPTATRADVRDACAIANKYGIKSVCVAPCNVELAAHRGVNVCAVIGFPHGNSTLEAKYAEAVKAMRDGATELDVVLNYGRFLDGDIYTVQAELGLIVATAHSCGVRVKAILESCFYTPNQLREMCHICVDGGVDFVKTSTGFFDGATVGVVQILIDSVGDQCRVKASGGVNTYARAARYLDMGCLRLGASNFFNLLP